MEKQESYHVIVSLDIVKAINHWKMCFIRSSLELNIAGERKHCCIMPRSRKP